MLTHLIDEHAMIHVHGTLASGKSTMAKLLFQHYNIILNIIQLSNSQ